MGYVPGATPWGYVLGAGGANHHPSM